MLVDPTSPVHIEAGAIYDDGSLRLLLGISSSSLREARRQGQIQYVKRGHRILYLGSWVLDWLNRQAAASGIGLAEEERK